MKRSTIAKKGRRKGNTAKPQARTSAGRRTAKCKSLSKARTLARLSVSLAPSLLRQLDRHAKSAGLTRDEVVAMCLRLGLRGSTSRASNPKSKQVGAGLDQVLTWMADQQAVLKRIGDSLAEVAAAVPVDNRPPAPEPGDDEDDDDRPPPEKTPA